MAGLEGYPELRGKFSASSGQQSGMDPFEQRSSSASMSPRSVNFEMLFWCLQISPKNNEISVRISALASKKRSNKLIMAIYTSNWRILY